VRGFFSAVQFLTRVPVPAGAYSIRSAFVFLPMVGLLLGGVLAGLDLLLRALGVQALLGSTLLVVAWLVLTGAIHADGLMDTCDAVFVHATPERRLEIMRDPRAGAFGVVGLLCVVLLKVAAIDALPGAWRIQALLLAPCLGRWGIALASTVFPYGRATGLGQPLKAAATPRAFALASVVPVALAFGFWPGGAMLLGLAAVVAVSIGLWLLRLLPGLTGDSYGAICETVETLVLVCAAPAASA
jgi:adenosylcobinamide-GDP ribazoletransferase